MISDRIESFVLRVRRGDAETMSLTETVALRSHLDEFIDESDLRELSELLSCYPTTTYSEKSCKKWTDRDI